MPRVSLKGRLILALQNQLAQYGEQREHAALAKMQEELKEELERICNELLEELGDVLIEKFDGFDNASGDNTSSGSSPSESSSSESSSEFFSINYGLVLSMVPGAYARFFFRVFRLEWVPRRAGLLLPLVCQESKEK